MTTEYWFLAAVGGLMVLALAFFAGRGMAPSQRRIEEMRRERDQARAEAERVQGEVARHFEQSARMFGRLADDYRLFFEHFAETAQNLGLSEGRARELLHRADPRLVADHTGPDGAAGEAGANGPASDEAGPAADTPAAEGTGVESEAAPKRPVEGTAPAAGAEDPDRAAADSAPRPAGAAPDSGPDTEPAEESGAEAAAEAPGERRH